MGFWGTRNVREQNVQERLIIDRLREERLAREQASRLGLTPRKTTPRNSGVPIVWFIKVGVVFAVTTAALILIPLILTIAGGFVYPSGQLLANQGFWGQVVAVFTGVLAIGVVLLTPILMVTRFRSRIRAWFTKKS